MPKRYEIVVTEIETYGVTAKEYQKIADTGNPRDGGAVYDYVETPATKERRTEVYKQVVEYADFHVYDVIKAANEKT